MPPGRKHYQRRKLAAMNAVGITKESVSDEARLKRDFLKIIAMTGNVALAARDLQAKGGPSISTWYRWKDSDVAFKESWDEALQMAVGDYRRVVRDIALTGETDRDRLRAATFMLNKLDPEFKEDAGGESTFIVNITIPRRQELHELPTGDATDAPIPAVGTVIVQPAAPLAIDFGDLPDGVTIDQPGGNPDPLREDEIAEQVDWRAILPEGYEDE